MSVFSTTEPQRRTSSGSTKELRANSFADALPPGYVHEDVIGLLTLRLLEGRSHDVIRTIDRLTVTLRANECGTQVNDLQMLRELAELNALSASAGLHTPVAETAIRFGLRILPTLKRLVSTHPTALPGEERRARNPSHRRSLPSAAFSKDEPLSPRETDVLLLTALGLSNKEIAGRLWISEGTVKKHLSHLFRKLQVRNRTEAVARARNLGLV